MIADSERRWVDSMPDAYQRWLAPVVFEAAGFSDARLETVTLTSPAASAADVAAGFCTGTPLRAEIDARGDVAETTGRVAGIMQDLLGSGPVRARMTAHVVLATSP